MKVLFQLIALLPLLFLTACPPKWRYLQPLDPYTRQPIPKNRRVSVTSSGLKIEVEKFYFFPELACLGVVVDNSQGYAEAYINPQKTKLVAGKLGTWALTSTQAAREPLFRKIALHFHRISDPKSVKLWSLLYLPRSRIPVRKKIRGLVCFQLIRYPGDPEPIKIKDFCRVKFEDVRVGGGKVEFQWLWFKMANGK